MKKKIQRIMGGFLAVIYLFMMLVVIMPERMEAGVFDNAYTFYQKYKNDMAFSAGQNKEGEIYYATKGKKAVSSGTQYTTIGWKVTMKDQNGSNIATLYYQLGGTHMTTVDVQLIDGYEYTLYKVTLKNMRSRITNEANEELKKANCKILFDACLALKVNGVIQGGMTDSGPSWGTVYTTYKGIANAASWSESTLETLKTYYNKSVEDIYYTVKLTKGDGVLEVNGGGSYCFGTMVTVNAVVDKKYGFSSWTGTMSSTSESYTFAVFSDVNLKANAKKRNLQVNFYKASSGSSRADAYRIYYNDTSGQRFPDFGWKKEGLHQVGWSLQKEAIKANYQVTNNITQNWIDKHIPSVNLYAVWEENQYSIVFDANMDAGDKKVSSATYTQEITLEEDVFQREGFRICGWSTNKDATVTEFKKGEKVAVSALAKSQNLEYEHGVEIVLYAVWDHAPVIDAKSQYVSLVEAKDGRIDESTLLAFARATDKEDGEVVCSLTNFAPTDFISFQKDGAVMLTFSAMDSAGNITKKNIFVYIVDTKIYDAQLIWGRPRFISMKYYKNEQGNLCDAMTGGLLENSIWRMDDNYLSVLEHALQ